MLSFAKMKLFWVYDAAGSKVGKFKDLVVKLEGDFPRVTKLAVARPQQEDVILPWDTVATLQYQGEDALALKSTEKEIIPQPLGEREILLGKTIMDRKVMDLHGKRAVRVNDIELEEVAGQPGQYRVAYVVTGFWGLLRHFKSSDWLAHKFKGKKAPLISWEHIEPLRTDPFAQEEEVTYEKLEKLHPADIADIVEELNPSERAQVIEALDEETASDTMAEIEPEVGAEVLQMVEDETAADILEHMEPDEAADILSDLPQEKAQELLETMDKEEAEDVAELLEHEEDTAGGLMTTEYIAFSPALTVHEAVERLRSEAPEVESIYYIFLIDEQETLLGVLTFKELLLASATAKLSELMETPVINVQPDTKIKTVAQTIAKYNLLALPVVDENQKLLGIITVDDVMEELVEIIWKKRAAKKYL
jgi:CBS domain-containing protein/sporulation protein YlmC with PRC-barrel domain